ncbi:MAG TPA: Asp-tRNA(Asn)/Glu-tRNA(Gln) amidotransferase subunit GatA [Oscillospiraceae bacterium]|nr:Asp-tRNA(Asn)/Glu-tRNA(Gln) amidotransferase subunit GatA [Oscillospiraceae bacterium]
MDLYKKTATELSSMLRDKKCSAIEITEAVFSRIDAVEDKVDAYITICKDESLEKAKQVDLKLSSGEALHPLAGIPIGLKDNISTKGILTSCASKMLYNYVPPFDATVTSRVKNADMIISGKLNLDEFAMGSSTENSFYKRTHNPHDLTRIPGGSSGGSAASVAAGEAVVSLGSDTGGSIRGPASFCGVVGLKPTYGSISRYGVVAFASSLDQVGPLGRCVTDVAMLYSLLCGHDKLDATSAKRNYPDFSSLLNTDIKGLRIGIPSEYFGDGVDDHIRQVVMDSISLLEKNGAKLVPINLPSTKYALATYYVISSAEASSNLARFDGVRYGYRAHEYDGLNDMYVRTRSEGFGDEVKRRIMLGTFVLSSGYFDAYYRKAKQVQVQISDEFSQAFKQCDVIATPTSPITAFKLGENINDPVKMYAADICTVTMNIAGLPAISVPCGYDNNKMPIGMQLIGDKFNEQLLLNTALAYETLSGGPKTMPEIV